MSSQQALVDELRNFQDLARVLKPSSGSVPELRGFDIHGTSLPLRGTIGGDHTIYLDFAKRYDLEGRIRQARDAGEEGRADELERCRDRAGILVADVSGHRVTDALIAAMLHQAFLLGVHYELDAAGRVTTRLFERINQRFYRTTRVHKYLTMIYGEISLDGRFRFISAGHPRPLLFSRESGRFVGIPEERAESSPPVGMFASRAPAGEPADAGGLGFKESYSVNEIELTRAGDLVLMYSDGLMEHGDRSFFPRRVEEIFAELPRSSSAALCARLRRELERWGEPEDDVSYVLVQRDAARDGARERK